MRSHQQSAPMKTSPDIFCFTIGTTKLALPLEQIGQVFRSVSIRTIPESSPRISGVIDFHGELIPVVNFRYRLGLPQKETGISERFILAFTEKRKIILVADEIRGVERFGHNEMITWDLPETGKQIAGITKCNNDIYFIYDLDQFLTCEDEMILDKFMNAQNKPAE